MLNKKLVFHCLPYCDVDMGNDLHDYLRKFLMPDLWSCHDSPDMSIFVDIGIDLWAGIIRS